MRNYDALNTADDKGAVRGHKRKISHEDLLFLYLARFTVYEACKHAKRRRICGRTGGLVFLEIPHEEKGPGKGYRQGGAVLLMSGEALKSSGAKPLARLVAYAHAGVDPNIMGIGPVPATQAVLKRAGLTIEQMDVIEANEAFAAQACAVAKELKLDPAKLNPNGSGISLGHPVGATGAIVTIKALYELQRTGGRYALVTMCIGGGQGIAAIFERA